MPNSKHQIKVGALISYMTLAVNILASLIYLPWMVRMIGRSNYALYTLATSFISLFLLDFGLSASVARFVAKYNAEGRQDRIDEVVSTVARLYLLLGMAIACILFVAYFFLGQIYTGLTVDEIRIFRQLYIIVSIYSVISFPFLPLSGILNAYELFIQQKVIELLSKLLTITLVVIALLLGRGVRALVLANATCGIAAIVLKLYIVRRDTSVALGIGRFNKEVFIEVAQFSIWATVVSLAQRCIFNLAPSILGIVSNSTEIALFGPANALEGYFYSVSAAVNGLFLATVSRYVANDEDEKINSLMIRVGRYQFIVLGMVFVEFACVGQDFMIQWMGQEFVGVWPCAMLLFIPDILIFSEQIANTAVIVKNKIKKQAFGYVLMALTCLVVSVPASKAMGALGACMAIAVSYCVLFSYMNVLYYRELEIDVFAFFRECYLKLAGPMLGVTLLGRILCNNAILLVGWPGVFAKGLVVLALYVVVVAFFLSHSERSMITHLLLCRSKNTEKG